MAAILFAALKDGYMFPLAYSVSVEGRKPLDNNSFLFALTKFLKYVFDVMAYLYNTVFKKARLIFRAK